MKNSSTWSSLAYWQTGEYQVIKERLKDYDKMAKRTGVLQYNPARADLFSALHRVPFDRVRVAILGQDPYPRRMHCTGTAFETPAAIGGDFPPTLTNLFREYSDDLGYPTPKNGDLTKWCEQGVLLWNVYPTCHLGKPGSHHWPEWELLTDEIISKLDGSGKVVFVCLGRIASRFCRLVHSSPRIETSHPSPLGANAGFLGSRIFSRVNAELVNLGQTPIDWRL